MFQSDCDAVDAFIATHKTLVGYLPAWGAAYAGLYQTRWAIADLHGIESGELCLTISHGWDHQTIVCVFRHKLIYRLDVAPAKECKPNWHTAHRYNLPAEVCGTHVHGWLENRDYVMVNGFGRLPVRRPTEASVLDLVDAVHWVATDLNIQVDPSQRAITLPPRTLV